MYLHLGCVIYARKRFYVNKSGYTGNFLNIVLKRELRHGVNYASKYGILQTVQLCRRLFIPLLCDTMEWWVKTLNNLNLYQHHQSCILWLNFRPTGCIFLIIYYHHSSANIITKYELNHTTINFLLLSVPVQYDNKKYLLCHLIVKPTHAHFQFLFIKIYLKFLKILLHVSVIQPSSGSF